MIRRTALACLALGLAGPAWAAGPGTTGAAFLKIGVGARALGMGGAYAAIADGADSVYWNPAGLSALTKRDATASFGLLFEDMSQGFVGYAAPAFGGTLGGGVDYLRIGSIEKRAGDTEAADSTFAAGHYAAALAYALPDTLPGLGLGASLKYIREDIDAMHAGALALDLGARYKTSVEGLNAALTAQNLGTSLASDPLPLTTRLGAAYRLRGLPLLAAADIESLWLEKRHTLDLGAEVRAAEALALRAGYRVGQSRDELGSGLVGFSAGLGLRFEGIALDYAFVPFGDLGNTHRLTLSTRF